MSRLYQITLWRRSRTRQGIVSSERSQSETVGVIILTGVIITIAVVLGVAMTANVMSQYQSGPTINLHGSATQDLVTLEHRGGARLDISEFDVVLRGESTERYALSSFTQVRGANLSRFEPSDRWQRNHGLSGDSMEVLLVHTPTNTISGRMTLELVSTGPFFEVDITGTNDPVEQGDTLNTSVSVRNTGIATGTQDIEFEFDGTLEDTETFTLPPASSTSATFAHDTSGVDPGQYTVLVSSDNRTAQRTVTVIEPLADVEITSVDGFDNGTTNQTYTPTVTVTESADVETESLMVELIIEERDTKDAVFEVRKEAPDDFNEIRAESLDVGFDVGTLEANKYNYFTTASADNAITSGNTGDFVVGEPPFFDVTIDGTNSPISAGSTARVTATINNTGGIPGTQRIRLNIDGATKDSRDLTLEPGEAQTITLEWDTSLGDQAGSPYTATVTSNDDSAETTVEVTGPGGTNPPTVETQAATDVGSSTATLNGELTGVGTASEVDVSFEYREAGATEWIDTDTQTRTTTGTFNEAISGLGSGSEYEFRAVAESADGDDTGDTLTFTTDAAPGAPTVETQDASATDSSSATLNGGLTDLGTASEVDVSFEYRETGTSTWIQTATQTRATTGTFDETVTGLDSGTEYEFRAVAESADGSDTGVRLTFTTDEDVTPPIFEGVTASDLGTGSSVTQTFTFKLSNGVEAGDEVEINLDGAYDTRGGPNREIIYPNDVEDVSTTGDGSLSVVSPGNQAYSIIYTVGQTDAGSEIEIAVTDIDTSGANSSNYVAEFILDRNGVEQDSDSDSFNRIG